MEIVKRIFVWTLPLLLLLGACRDQDEPTAHVAGSILAGEMGPGIRSMTFSNPIQIDGASISNNEYEIPLDSSLQQSVIFHTSRYSGWGYNHGTCAVNTSALAIELASAEMNDTLWKCKNGLLIRASSTAITTTVQWEPLAKTPPPLSPL